MSNFYSKLSILSYHDAIEIFLYMAKLHNEKTEKINFLMDFWKIFPNLSHKSEIDRLRIIRNSLKHKVIEPPDNEIIQINEDVSTFFNSNCNYLFGLNFSDISMTSLIIDRTIQNLMIESENALKEGHYTESVDKSAKAYFNVLYFQDNWLKREIEEKRELRSYSRKRRIRGNLDEIDKLYYYEKLEEDISSAISSLPIDTRKYYRYKNVVYDFIRHTNGEFIIERIEEEIDEALAQFCLDFVLEVILAIQDFELKTLA